MLCPGTAHSEASKPRACHGPNCACVAAGGTFPLDDPPGRKLSQTGHVKSKAALTFQASKLASLTMRAKFLLEQWPEER